MSGQEKESVILTRDCEAVVVPLGDRVLLQQGVEVTITQALGGSYTIYLQGHLFRIDGTDADALGKVIVEAHLWPRTRAMRMWKKSFGTISKPASTQKFPLIS